MGSNKTKYKGCMGINESDTERITSVPKCFPVGPWKWTISKWALKDKVQFERVHLRKTVSRLDELTIKMFPP